MLEISENEWIFPFTMKVYIVFTLSVENPGEKITGFFCMLKKFSNIEYVYAEEIIWPRERRAHGI